MVRTCNDELSCNLLNKIIRLEANLLPYMSAVAQEALYHSCEHGWIDITMELRQLGKSKETCLIPSYPFQGRSVLYANTYVRIWEIGIPSIPF